MEPLPVITWKWGDKFSPEYVNKLKSMVKRHLTIPHYFACLCEDSKGLDKDIIKIPMFYYNNALPGALKEEGCLRRLKMFSPEFETLFGEKFLHIDLDSIICGDITKLIQEANGLKIWKSTSYGRKKYALNPSFVLINFKDPNTSLVWDIFNKDKKYINRIFKKIKRGSFLGSDQRIISYILHDKNVETWDNDDGFYSIRDQANLLKGSLPENAKYIGFFGCRKQTNSRFSSGGFSWIRSNWN